MESLILNGKLIRVDEHGRYSLTDLWKAGGSLETKKPSKFERTDRHSELVDILKGRNLPFISRTRYYLHKEFMPRS